MGLDMYLKGKKFLWTDWEHPENNRMEDGHKLSYVILQLAYWRKHPNLHGYIVKNFAGGVDECQDIYLNSEALRQIIKAVKEKDLPSTEGFFFGKSDGSETEEDTALFESALTWLEEKVKGESRDVIYRASW